MVEAFKTNVDCPLAAASLIRLLKMHYLHCEISFDLDDCDRVLRIAGPEVHTETIMRLLRQQGFDCKVLE